jgi:hypothetical protein
MKTIKTMLKILLYSIGGLLAVILLSAALLTVLYITGKQEAGDYLGKDFLVYMRIDSIMELYDNTIDLKAAEIVLAESNMTDLYTSLLEFKSSAVSRSWIFRELLNIETNIQVINGNIPVIVLDPGFKAVLTQVAPRFDAFFAQEGISVTKSKAGRNTIYGFTFEESDMTFYLSFKNNLIFFSLEEAGITYLYENKERGTNFRAVAELANLDTKLPRRSTIKFYISTRELIQSLGTEDPFIQRLTGEILLGSRSIIGIAITNDELILDGFTSIDTENPILMNFLSENPKKLRVIPYLPDTTNIYASINIPSLESVYELVKELSPEGQIPDLSNFDGPLKTALGLDTQELLFDWAGGEIGTFTLENSPDPVAFIRIQDKRKFEKALEALVNSPLLKKNDTLVLDDIRIPQIELPGFWKFILSAFIQDIDTPFFTQLQDYLFLSMNPEPLQTLHQKYRAGELLISSESYRKITADSAQNASFFFYYDLNTALPKILAENTILTKVLQLYQRGVSNVVYEPGSLTINLTSLGSTVDRTSALPGFPRLIDNSIDSNLILSNIDDGNPELVYIDRRGVMNFRSLNGELKNELSISRNADIFKVSRRNSRFPISRYPLGLGNGDYGLGIAERQREEYYMIYDDSGSWYYLDSRLRIKSPPFPLKGISKAQFMPAYLESRNSFLTYDLSDKTFLELMDSGEIKRFEWQTEKNVLHTPVVIFDQIFYYEKDLFGTIQRKTFGGENIESWPQLGGGVADSGLIAVKSGNKHYLVYLAKRGTLNIWEISNANDPGTKTTQSLDGSFSIAPVFIRMGNTTAILSVSDTGTLFLNGLDGSLIARRDQDDFKKRDFSLYTYDTDGDGEEEIFIYGGGNAIYGFDSSLKKLLGFPVKGSSNPVFFDFNGDGFIELFTLSFDENIYAYTIRK